MSRTPPSLKDGLALLRGVLAAADQAAPVLAALGVPQAVFIANIGKAVVGAGEALQEGIATDKAIRESTSGKALETLIAEVTPGWPPRATPWRTLRR